MHPMVYHIIGVIMILSAIAITDIDKRNYEISTLAIIFLIIGILLQGMGLMQNLKNIGKGMKKEPEKNN